MYLEVQNEANEEMEPVKAAGVTFSLDEFLGRLEVLESDVADLKRLKSDVADLKSETGRLKSDVADLKSETGRLKSEVERLESELDGVRLDLRETSATVDNINEQVVSRHRDFQGISNGMTEQVGELQQAREAGRTPSAALLGRFRSLRDSVHNQTLFLGTIDMPDRIQNIQRPLPGQRLRALRGAVRQRITSVLRGLGRAGNNRGDNRRNNPRPGRDEN